MVAVPSNWVWWVKEASQKTGIPYPVVACQINLESGFNPNATSPAGAEGIAQFLPSTLASYGGGNAYNPNDALRGYINFMNYLMRVEFGNLHNALAAYNAGPGNIPAGFGYAAEILSCAGQGPVLTVPGLGGPPLGVAPTNAVVSKDDWSRKVRNSGDQVHAAAANMLSAGRSIRRL